MHDPTPSAVPSPPPVPTGSPVPTDPAIAVVIPSYRVRLHILEVIASIGPEVARIFVVDDCCPDQSGDFVVAHCPDPRVTVLRHTHNQGVGGAVCTGYQAAVACGMQVIVKIDGDGQMDPGLIPEFVEPILSGTADYTKGNRFFDLEDVHGMPRVRIFGNAMLSFMNKLSSGYWNLFDPTNGYTAIDADVVRHVPLNRLSKRYFFETDILFRLNALRAVVVDIPMAARYGDETSHLHVRQVIGEFSAKHLRNFMKRIAYNYYLRDLSVASFELPLGLGLFLFGTLFGGWHWIQAAQSQSTTPAGTVMLAALPVLLGLQLLLAFIGHDIASVPVHPIARSLRPRRSLQRWRAPPAQPAPPAAPTEPTPP